MAKGTGKKGSGGAPQADGPEKEAAETSQAGGPAVAGHEGGAQAQEERLPWLQKVEDEPERGRGPGGLLLAAIGVAVVALVLLLIFLSLNRNETASPSQIAANEVDQNLVEETEGGNRVAPGAETAAPALQPVAPAEKTRAEPARPAVPAKRAAQTPARQRASMGETRAKTAAATVPAPARSPATQVARVKPEQPTVKRPKQAPARATPPRPALPAYRGRGQVLQIGAFASRAAAERAWNRIAGAHSYRGGRPAIERALVHGRTFYRLRVTMPAGRNPCVTGRRTCFLVPAR